MATDNLHALQPADLWDGLPAGVLFSDIKSALLMDRPGRNLLEVNWAAGPFRSFGDGTLQQALRFDVKAPRVAWTVYTQPKAVSQILLTDGRLFNVTSTAWLLSDE
jgi:hypothetical protein